MTPLTVTTTINAPIALVWDCFTLPEHITGWNFASPDWCCPKAENDLRVGGNFSWRMEARDGSMGFDFAGTYTQIEPQHVIAYSFGDRKAVVTFAETAQGIAVTETFDPETQNPIEMQQAGWQAILDNFKKYVEEKHA